MKVSTFKLIFFLFCILISVTFTIVWKDYFQRDSTYQAMDLSHVNERCQGDERRLCVPPFEVFEMRFRTAPKYKLSVCAIEKNLSTILTAIMCFLYNEQKFKNSSRNINHEDFHHRFCWTKNEAFDLNTLERKFSIHLNEWTHIVPVREPVERFISGFTDKCLIEKVWKKHPSLCNGCKMNVSCFAERQYVRMMRYVKGDSINSFDDRHFFPQNWRCQFYEYYRRYRVIYYSSKDTDSFFKEFYSMLKEAGVSDKSIAFIDRQLHEDTTKHATSDRDERAAVEKEVRSNPRILNLLIRMYYYDFLLFGFSLPKIVEDF